MKVYVNKNSSLNVLLRAIQDKPFHLIGFVIFNIFLGQTVSQSVFFVGMLAFEGI